MIFPSKISGLGEFRFEHHAQKLTLKLLKFIRLLMKHSELYHLQIEIEWKIDSL